MYEENKLYHLCSLQLFLKQEDLEDSYSNLSYFFDTSIIIFKHYEKHYGVLSLRGKTNYAKRRK